MRVRPRGAEAAPNKELPVGGSVVRGPVLAAPTSAGRLEEVVRYASLLPKSASGMFVLYLLIIFLPLCLPLIWFHLDIIICPPRPTHL